MCSGLPKINVVKHMVSCDIKGKLKNLADKNYMIIIIIFL